MTGLPTLHTSATSPAQLAHSQIELIKWCDDRNDAEQLLLDDAEENLEHAKKHKWKISGWKSRASLSKQKIRYLGKVKSALEAGYYILPDIPNTQYFAIRTSRAKPPKIYSTSKWNWPELGITGEEEGVGEYVSVFPLCEAEQWTDDKSREHFKRTATQHDSEVDFPIKNVKLPVIEATTKAMALKAFDRFGVIPQGRGDPMVIGEIKRPGSRYGEHLTFFVAWWIDSTDILR